MKRIIILVAVLFVGLALMTYLYFSKLGLDKNAKDLALQSATNNAALVFSFQNDKGFYSIIEGQQLLQQAIGADKMQLLEQLKNNLISNPAINSFIQDQQIYISVLPDSNKQLNFLVTVQIKADKKPDQLYEALKNKQLKKIDAQTFSVNLNDSTKMFIGVQNQVFTVSSSLKLIQNANVRLSENPFTEYIKENSGQTKNVLANVYINFNHAPLLLKNIIVSNLNGELAVFNKQNSFATLNYNFSKEKILFNGSSLLAAPDNFLKLFEKSPAQTTSIQNILPENTANYVMYAYDNYTNWLKTLKDWQQLTQEIKKTDVTINGIKRDYRIDLNAIFPVFAKNQFIVFQLSTTEKLGAIDLTNGEKVKQLLLDISGDYSDEIKIFKSSNILNAYFGEPFKKFARPYYTIIDNHLVVANNASTIQSFLNSYRNNRLLIQTPEYQDAMNQVSTTSNVSFYINTKNSKDIFRNHILLRYYKHLRADSGLKSFDTFYYQMSSDQNKFITNLLLNKYLKPKTPDSTSNR